MQFINIMTATVVAFAWFGAAAADNVPPRSLKLLQVLDGRTAGKATDCLSMRGVRSTRMVDRAAILFEVGDTLYVNATSAPELLSDSKILVTRPYSSRLCKGEAVSLFDNATGAPGSAVLLAEFVPYRKRASHHLSQLDEGHSDQGIALGGHVLDLAKSGAVKAIRP